MSNPHNPQSFNVNQPHDTDRLRQATVLLQEVFDVASPMDIGLNLHESIRYFLHREKREQERKREQDNQARL